jgi:hypothetical protein
MAEQESKATQAAADNAGLPTKTFAEFLETVPPGQFVQISNLAVFELRSGYREYLLQQPDLLLHCSDPNCNGPRFFRCTDDDVPHVDAAKFEQLFIRYKCSNCRSKTKTYALFAQRAKEKISGECYKLGEYPPYGPPTPSRLISMIGTDRETFLKGRQCENQGLGVGAFVYYRRVVENQKDRILDQIIKVASKIDTATSLVPILEAAKKETQFSKAIASVKGAMPQALLIDGQNPLTLLHSALSEGLHGKTDEECLELAQAARIVLAELSERISQALKDEVELNSALRRLQKK